MIMDGHGRSWKVMEGHGRSWKVMEGNGRSLKVMEVRSGRGMDGLKKSQKDMEGH